LNSKRTDSGSVTPSVPPPPSVTKTQWLNFGGSDSLANLAGRNILIVDEVDDTRQTLSYAVQELLRDIEKQEKATPGHEPTKLGVFVLHNKVKQKKASLPDEVMKNYFACVDMPDNWLVYPWDAIDIEEHTAKANRKELIDEL
jgi:hypoxanthine phosphoribosyltransferase